jgi:hypothetical protein
MLEFDEPRLGYDEQVRLARDVIRRTDQSVRPNGALFVAWGATLSFIDAVFLVHYKSDALSLSSATAISDVLAIVLLAGTATSVVSLKGPASGTQVDRQTAISFSSAAILLFTLINLHYAQWLLPGAAYGLLTNATFCIPMLSLGIQYRERALLAGGALLLASLLAMRLDPSNVDLYAACGIGGGLLGPGLYFLVWSRRTAHG